jgi:hypothetical protein
MRLFFAILLTACLFSCAPAPHSLKALQRALPSNYRISGQMDPVISHLWEQEAAALPVSTPERDSVIFANTAIAAGQYMRAAWQRGQFTESEKAKARIKNSTTWPPQNF